jgi:SNF2 family DNA or RNA helicase
MSPIDAEVPMEHYIPTGCLEVSLSQTSQFSSLTEVPKPHSANTCWVGFELGSSTTTQPVLGLGHGLENCLSQCLQPFHSLLAKQWIKIRFRKSLDDPDRLVLRVYCLPDDVERRRVDRTPEKLRRSRKELLSQLDYAYTKWEGRVGYDRLNTPRYFDNWLNMRDAKEQSLLELFNSLPSPDPQPDKIEDPDTRDIVRWLLEKNDLHGMWTKLYPYQQRSVAMMIQRESQQHKVLDARYVKVVDQEGGLWYYDQITGTSLRHAPMYDSVCGGILAEEMGSGKTLMCLALVLATRHQSSRIPDIWRDRVPYRRKKIGSLADMAAATATRNGSPWRLYFDHNQGPLEFSGCLKAIDRNPGCYHRPTFSLGSTRSCQAPPPPKKIWLSHTTLIIVPSNLMKQWKHEIAKHTTDLEYIAMERLDSEHGLPPLQEILKQDVLLISNSVFESLGEESELTKIHFKRCVVDEGHRLGSSYKSNRRKVLESLHITARWIASGTPAKGLYGVDRTVKPTKGRNLTEESAKQEAEDLKRLGGLATQYLKLMPFCYTDTDWSTYVMQPRHSNRSSGTQDTLRSIMETLIIRHRTDELSKHLPKVNEKVVLLDGSYQDKLSLNLFSMMIIFNAVQSERKDQDYFFHERQRSALLQLVSNMKQASFFGGGFFPPEIITGAVETADKFLKEAKVPISSTDEVLLRQAIAFGHRAARNHLKQLSAQSHMVPIYIQDFPGRAEDRRAWSLDDKTDDPVCIHSELVEAMQKYLRPMIDAPYNLETKFQNGDFELQGNKIRESKLAAAAVTETGPGSGPTNSSPTAKKGAKSSASTRMSRISLVEEDKVAKDEGVADALLKARVISTASAKLTYLVDQIVKHQQEEQIIVFYEHDNSAYYIASMLETLQIQHLIYANSVRVDRRAQYIDTFNYNLKFR